MKNFFNHRLASSAGHARTEWLSIIEGTHSLWQSVPSEKKELIRAYLNLLNLEILKRARPSSVFNFQSASLGNLFLTGARLFSGSLESSLYALRSFCQIPEGVEVLPVINTGFTHHICAGLEDGSKIVGQNSISHPSSPTALPSLDSPSPPQVEGHDFDDADSIEDANLPGSLPTLRKAEIEFSKHAESDLPARIHRIWYINPYGQEIRPAANPKVLRSLHEAKAVVYSIGSLYTSIVPCLILKGIGSALRNSLIKYKILILNGSLDRETCSMKEQFSAVDFIAAIVTACQESRGSFEVPGKDEYRNYVTHLIHLEGRGCPRVDSQELAGLGINCLRIYGRRDDHGGARYDGAALAGAMDAVMGKGERARSMSMGD